MKTADPKSLIQENFDEAIETAVQTLKRSDYIHSLIQELHLQDAEIREHLATLIKVDEDHQSIQQCHLAKKCLKPSGHYQLQVSRNVMGHLERTLQPCPLLDDQLKVGQFLIYDDFDANYKASKLFTDLNLRAGRKPLYQYLMKVLLKETTEGLYLHAPAQSGKTFALGVFSYRYALNELGTIGLIDTPRQLTRLLALKRSDYNGFSRELDRLQNLKVLILDDVDRQPITEAMLTDILIPLFEARLAQPVMTMVTARVPLSELNQVFKGYKDKRVLMQTWIELVAKMTMTINLPAMLPL
jgi:DNA replication protein DnaC